MRSTVLLVFTILVIGSSAVSTDPVEIAKTQVRTVMNAVEVEDKNIVMELIKTDDADRKNVMPFIRAFKEIKITVKSAKTDSDGSIDAEILFNGKVPGSIVLKKHPSSPTGYQIVAIGSKALDKKGTKEKFIEFTMCYIGLFWCAIEITVDILDGKYGR